MATASTALLPTMGSWLEDRAQRAMAAAGAVAVITLSAPAFFQLVVGPKLPFGMGLIAVLVTVAATAALIRVAVRGGDPRWPARAVFLVGMLTLLITPAAAPHAGVAAWPVNFSAAAGAVVVVGWRPLHAVMLAVPFAVLQGVAVHSPAGGDSPVTESAVQGLLLFCLVLAISAGATALRHSTRSVAGQARGVRAMRGQAESLASAAHLKGYWTAVVHDTVLSVLASVSRLADGPMPEQARQEARRAVRELSTKPESMPCRAGELAGWLESLLGELDGATFQDAVEHRRALDRPRFGGVW